MKFEECLDVDNLIIVASDMNKVMKDLAECRDITSIQVAHTGKHQKCHNNYWF